MSMSEVLKEAKLMQYNIEFCRMGLLPIALHTDADVARAFCHMRGVGRMKHLDVWYCWQHEELEKGNFKVKRVDRKHSPSVEELRKFLPMIGCHNCEQRELQYSQDDSGRDACSKRDCISDKSGGCSEVVIAGDLAGIVVRMDEFALSVSSLESACNSSFHLFVCHVALRWTRFL